MVSTIIIFFLTLIIAIAMIARKIWLLQNNSTIIEPLEEADWTDISVEEIRNRIIEITKFGVHHFVLIMLKAWIITSNWVKRTDTKIKNRLMYTLHKNAHGGITGKPSGFIKKIRQHKDEIVLSIQKESIK
jgi:hypothetical protein